MNLSAKTRRILKGESPMPLYYFALAPFGFIYSLVVRARAAMYRAGLLKTHVLPCKVISVGNLTAGGTGKTPTVICLARKMAAKGLKIAVLTRGYGGSYEGRIAVVSDGDRLLQSPKEAGDEAVLLAMSLPDTPVIMGSDRYKAGLVAIERFKPDVVILDDGYQHLSLKRDLNILLLDVAHPFGNGFTLPMGYLREPACSIKRAGLIVLTRADTASGTGRISEIAPSIPVIRATHKPSGLRGLWDGENADLETLAGARVVAVSGIADPASFSLILQKFNAKMTKSFEYPDHHVYRPSDLAEIEAVAKETGASMAVTTEKDAVKLKMLEPGRLRFMVLGIEMEFIEGAEALEGLVLRSLGCR
jgi:tetraacyldisaccharide 4'-kinase